MQIPAQLVKELREENERRFRGLPAPRSWKASGDIEKPSPSAKERPGRARKKSHARSIGRLVGSYIHPRKNWRAGELNCESTSWRARMRSSSFRTNIAMHIAALDPRYVRREEVTPEMLEKERDIYRRRRWRRASRKRSSKKIVNGRWRSSTRKMPLRTALHQDRERDHRRNDRPQHLQARRKYFRSGASCVSRSAKSAAGRQGRQTAPVPVKA